MSEKGRVQLNVRITRETAAKLDEIISYYQENTRFGRIYKNDVLSDIIDEAYSIMCKQREKQGKRYY